MDVYFTVYCGDTHKSSCGDYLFYMEKYDKMNFKISYIGGINKCFAIAKNVAE